MKNEKPSKTNNKKTLLELRKEQKISRNKLAEILKISPQSIYNYETYCVQPSVTVAQIIAKYFNMNVEDIQW